LSKKEKLIKVKFLEDLKNILKDNKSYIESHFHVKNIGIFGSFVREEETEESDVDLIVEFEKGYKDLFNYIDLKFYLEELLNRKVDLVMKEAVRPRLKKKIFDEVQYV
jgi:predicted nucleotidyltransferase